MPFKVSIQVEGLAKLQRKLRADVLLAPPLTTAMTAGLQDAVRIVESRAPRRTGRLAASVTYRLQQKTGADLGASGGHGAESQQKVSARLSLSTVARVQLEIGSSALVSRGNQTGPASTRAARRSGQAFDRTDLGNVTSLRAIRLGLKAQLETVTGLRAYDVWPTTINPPVAIVRPLSGTFHESFDGVAGGEVTYQFEITLLLQLGDQVVAQEQLDGYIATDGDMSILSAVEADPTLGGVADSTSVTGWRDVGTMRVGADENGQGPEFMGVRFEVEVLA